MREEKNVLGLTTIRRNRGISLEEIADSTKISIRALEAIEQGEFRKLPGGIYNTSYIKQYARAIDYDESMLLAFYHREMARVLNGTPTGGRGDQMFSGGLRSASTLFGS
jgi:cytoskeletal protein RodZ